MADTKTPAPAAPPAVKDPFADLFAAAEFEERVIKTAREWDGPILPQITAIVAQLVKTPDQAFKLPVTDLTVRDDLHAQFLAAARKLGKTAYVSDRLNKDSGDLEGIRVSLGDKRGRKTAETPASGSSTTEK